MKDSPVHDSSARAQKIGVEVQLKHPTLHKHDRYRHSNRGVLGVYYFLCLDKWSRVDLDLAECHIFLKCSEDNHRWAPRPIFAEDYPCKQLFAAR